LPPEQVGQLREVDEPVRVPGGPIVVGPIADPEDDVVGLPGLVEQLADFLRSLVHVDPAPVGAGTLRPVARARRQLSSASMYERVGANGEPFVEYELELDEPG